MIKNKKSSKGGVALVSGARESSGGVPG